MRILAIDPGEKNIGLAISDPLGVIANPLKVIKHISREEDAATIIQEARQNEVGLIVVGQALNEDGAPTPQSRRSARLAMAIRKQFNIRVILWDESYSTKAARDAHLAMGVTRRKRRGHLDDIAATYILQTFLDSGVHETDI